MMKQILNPRSSCRAPRGLALLAALLALPMLAGAQQPGAAPDEAKPNPEARLTLQTMNERLSVWRTVDTRFLQISAQFIELTERRRELIEGLEKVKLRGEPEDLSLASVRSRKAIARISQQYDHLIGEFRDLQRQTWRLVRTAHQHRGDIEPALHQRRRQLKARLAGGIRGRSNLSEKEQHELDRVTLWIKAYYEATAQGGPQHFVHAIMGEDLSRLMLYANSPGRGERGSDRRGMRPDRDRGSGRPGDDSHRPHRSAPGDPPHEAARGDGDGTPPGSERSGERGEWRREGRAGDRSVDRSANREGAGRREYLNRSLGHLRGMNAADRRRIAERNQEIESLERQLRAMDRRGEAKSDAPSEPPRPREQNTSDTPDEN